MPATTWWYGEIVADEDSPSEIEELKVKSGRRGTTGTPELLTQLVDQVVAKLGKRADWVLSVGNEDGIDRDVAYHSKDFAGTLWILDQPRMDDLRNTEAVGTGKARMVIRPAPDLLQLRWAQDPNHYRVRHLDSFSPFPGEITNLENYVDSSYGNDMSKSVTFSIGDTPYVLWVSPARIFDRTREQRDSGFLTYELQRLIRSGGSLQDDLADKQVDADVISTDDPAELMREIDRLYNEHTAQVRARAAAAGAQAISPERKLIQDFVKLAYNGWTFAPYGGAGILASHPDGDHLVEISLPADNEILVNVFDVGDRTTPLGRWKTIPFPRNARTPEALLGLVRHTLDEWQPAPPAIDHTAARFAQLDLDRGPRKRARAEDLEEDDTAKRFKLIELNPARGHKLEIGDLVARVEAPTVLYRVTSTIRGAKDMFRILPYNRSGREHVLVRIGGAWTADGSRWSLAQENPPRTARLQKVVSKLERGPAPASPRQGLASSPDQLITDVLADYLSEKPTESFLVLHVNVRNQIIGYTEYASGSVSGVEVHVSGIMRDALGVGGAAIISVHNHPTGNAEPSPDDRKLWLRLRQAGQLLGIPVLDNMIVGDGQFFSESMEEGGGNGISRIAPRATRAAERGAKR